MNEPNAQWENRIKTVASTFTYPPTPDVTRGVRQTLAAQTGRRPHRPGALAWAVVLVLLLVTVLLAVPQVRAAVLRIFHIGAITILEIEDLAEGPPPAPGQGRPPSATAVTAVTAVPTVTVVPPGMTPVTAVPQPSAAPLQLAGFATAVTLNEAQVMSPAPLYLPAYPADLGEPDHVYIQDTFGVQATIFTWQDEADPAQTRLALYQIWVDQYAYKGAAVIQETTIDGRRAIWLEGPHYFQLQSGRLHPWQFVEGNVLIWWAEAGVTFRLEGAKSLTEAVRIAESFILWEE